MNEDDKVGSPEIGEELLPFAIRRDEWLREVTQSRCRDSPTRKGYAGLESHLWAMEIVL